MIKDDNGFFTLLHKNRWSHDFSKRRSLQSLPEFLYEDNARSKCDMNILLSLDRVNTNGRTLLANLRAKSDEEQEIIYLLKNRISTFDNKTKIIMEKYFFEDKTIREIGKALKIAKSTVAYRLTKGIRNLKKFIQIRTNRL